MANATRNRGASALPNSDAVQTMALAEWQKGNVQAGIPEGAIVHKQGDPVMVIGPDGKPTQKLSKKGKPLSYASSVITLPKRGNTDQSIANHENIGLAVKPIVSARNQYAASRGDYIVLRHSEKREVAGGLPTLTTTLKPINLQDEFGRLRAKHPTLKDKTDAELAKALGIELPKTAIPV